MPRPGLAPQISGGASLPASRETTRRSESEPFAIWRPNALVRRRQSVVTIIANVLALGALFASLLCGVWEYSTERYTKGFSDAIIPASATGEEKVNAILRWMSQGPRRENGAESSLSDRDPTDTLNYARLLHECGSATNAFLNLAHSGGLQARRLLLLDSQGRTVHVVSEVLLDNRWIVVDPAFRKILRSPSGVMLTRQDLAVPSTWATATAHMEGYSSAYTFGNTEHVHLAKLGVVGYTIERGLNRFAPRWAESPAISLLFERRSRAALCVSLAVLLLFAIGRVTLAGLPNADPRSREASK